MQSLNRLLILDLGNYPIVTKKETRTLTEPGRVTNKQEFGELIALIFFTFRAPHRLETMNAL
jgi:hypothetical protein